MTFTADLSVLVESESGRFLLLHPLNISVQYYNIIRHNDYLRFYYPVLFEYLR